MAIKNGFSKFYWADFWLRKEARGQKGVLEMKKWAPVVAAISVLILSGAVVFFVVAGQWKSVSTIATEQGRTVVYIATQSKIGLNIGTGSGFLVSKDGLLVTNFHVTEDAHVAVVKLSNGDVYDSIGVINIDPRKDIAVLKIKAQNLPYVSLGDSDTLNVGEKVIAIGNPAGLEQTVSDGVISGIRKSEEGLKIIQISAPISPGSSGGPLFNSKGKVIGITTATIEGAQNLNFAIPINYLKPLIENKEAIPLNKFQDDFQQKQWFGGGLNYGIGGGLKPSNNLRASGTSGITYDLSAIPYNAIIRHFNEISSAREAGLKIGDVIIEINGNPIKSYDDLFKVGLGALEGDKASVKALRGGKTITTEFILTKITPTNQWEAVVSLLQRKIPVRLAIMWGDFSLSQDSKEIIEAQQKLWLEMFGHSKYFSLIDTGQLDYIFSELTKQYGVVTPEIRNRVLKSMGVTYLTEVSLNYGREMIKNKLIDLNTNAILMMDGLTVGRNQFTGRPIPQLDNLNKDLQEYLTYVNSLPQQTQDYVSGYFGSLIKKYVE